MGKAWAVTGGGVPSKELLTQLSAQWTVQRLRERERERIGTSLRRNPRNPGGWHRPLPLPGAGLGCFGWLPPAYQTVTWWGKFCETALTMAAKNCEKKGAWKTGRPEELGEGEDWLGEPGKLASQHPSPSLGWACDLTQPLAGQRARGTQDSTEGSGPFCPLLSPSGSQQSFRKG